MQYERPSEPSLWKDKLNDLDHLPGEEMPDKTRSWEELHGRLLKEPGHTITRWYWTAAACLVLSIGIPWLSKNEKDDYQVKNTMRPAPGSPANRQTPSTGNPMAPSYTLAEPKHPHPATTKIKQSFQAAKKQVETNNSALEQTEPSIEIIPEIQSLASGPDTVAIAKTIPVKKKLRVVHINELDTQDAHMPFARTDASPAFRIKSPDDDFSVFTVSRNSSDNILKIKLSPTN